MRRILKVILGFNIVSLVHLIRLNPKQFLHACVKAFTASQDASYLFHRIPTISLGEILGDRKPAVQLPVMKYEDGMLPSEEAMALLAILVAEAPAEVLEVGTYMGHTTRQMAENLPAAIIHTVDLPQDFSPEQDPEQNLLKDDFHLIARRTVGREFKGRPCASRIKQHFGDTANWDFREAANATCFFVDGSHTYEYCENDSAKCLELCGGRGVFLWHDCDRMHPGVVEFVSEWRRQGRDIRRIAGTVLAYWKSS